MTLIRLFFLVLALSGAVYIAALNADLHLADVAMLGALGPFPGGWLVAVLFGVWSLWEGATSSLTTILAIGAWVATVGMLAGLLGEAAEAVSRA